MDWSDYSEEGRESTKIYEDSYVSSWGVSEDSTQLVPEGFTIGQEKAAIIDCVNSNKYNITQAIAEAFNVFCQYEYKCTANGSFVREYIDQGALWTGRKVVFYNKAVKKDKPLYIEYQKNLNSISRESDTSEIYTKMYVPKIESSIQSTGYISIADAAVNPLKDDFILNFDYLYSIGSISDYQKNTIKNYELQIRKYNDSLIDYEASIITMEEELNELETKLAFYKNEVIQAQEQHNEYQTLRDSIVGDELVERNSSNPYSVIFYEDGANKRATIRLSSKGIDLTKDFIGYSDAYLTQIFSNNSSNLIVTTEERQTSSEDKNFYLLVDSVGLPIGLYTNKNNLAGITYVYLKLTYDPKNVYEKVCIKLMETVISKQAYVNKYEQLVKTQQNELDTITKERDNILLSKEQENLRFESILGPALREGYWNPDTAYEDPGNEKIKNIKEQSFLLFDTELFEGEDKAYYYATAENLFNDERTYYNYINIKNMADSWKEKDLTQLVLHLKNPKSEQEVGEILAERYIYPNAGFIFGLFANEGKEIIPVIILNDTDIKYKYYNTIAYSFSTDIANAETETTLAVSTDAGNYTLCYPRIELKENNINYNSTLQTLKNGDKELEEYKDYTILLRKGYPYYTLKVTENVNIYDILKPDFCLTYIISRANEKLYLDAKEVAFENSRPRYSYEVEVAMLPDAIENAELGQLVYINDYSLGLHNVSGYIDSITLQLDKQSEDKITIKNYKTKFEDLFETITATSEAMRNNQHSYDAAAGSFNPDGTISGDILQSSINSNNISLNFSNTNVAINDKDGILLTNTSAYSNGVYGQVALRGNGIFLSNSVDDNGERIWGTGITASGINASYLRAGQLDTNLIRIYSGDNIAFQWNPEGIFAYAHDENGVPIINKYVHYSDKGLQYVDNKHTAVDLGWNGLLISTQGGSTELTGNDGLTVYYGKKNEEGTNYAVRLGRFDENQVLSYGLKLYKQSKDDQGKDVYSETLVTRNDGTLWLQDSITVGAENGMVGITGEGETTYNTDTGDIDFSPVRIWAGGTEKNNANFRVKEDGSLFATQANITGSITATSGSFSGIIYASEGNIGGWKINNEGLISSREESSFLSNDEGQYLKVGDNFLVDYNGDVTIKGKITATNGKIGNWVITEDGNLKSEDDNTIFSGSDNSDQRINIGNNNFIVNADGHFIAEDASIKGNITAETGKIGEWVIDSYGLTSSNNSAGLYAGGEKYYINKNGENTTEKLRFWAGEDSESYVFAVVDSGKLYAKNAEITGNIFANGGYFSDNFYIGVEEGKRIEISNNGGKPFIGTSTYSSNVLGSGWRINYDGSAEFENVSVRGKISSAVFEHNHISSIGGSLYIAPTIYIEVSSDAITPIVDTTDSYIISWKNAGFDPINTGGHEWRNGEKIKLDGVLFDENDSTTQDVSDISGEIIIPQDNNPLAAGELRIKVISAVDLTNKKINPGAAIILHGTAERRQGLFLTAVGEGAPFLEIYDNDGKSALSTPAVRLGNLEGITDEYLGEGHLSGYGLYSSNAYLRGELRLPGAGITNQEGIKKDNSNVRIWAGLKENVTNIDEANFVVTEDGSLYAYKGVFSGTVIATESEFSGAIKTAGIIIDNPSTENEKEGISDHFYVAYKDSPTFEDYILNIDSTGLSIWEGGLRAYSDYASEENGNSCNHIVYSYKDGYAKLPYFYLIDEGIDKNLYARTVNHKGHYIAFASDGKKANSIILDNGIWFKNKIYDSIPSGFEEAEQEIFKESRENGLFLKDNSILQLKSPNGIEIETNIDGSFKINDKIQLNTNNSLATLKLSDCIIQEVTDENGKAIGLNFIASAE